MEVRPLEESGGSFGSPDGVVEIWLMLLKVDGLGGTADTGGDRPL